MPEVGLSEGYTKRSFPFQVVLERLPVINNVECAENGEQQSQQAMDATPHMGGDMTLFGGPDHHARNGQQNKHNEQRDGNHGAFVGRSLFI